MGLFKKSSLIVFGLLITTNSATSDSSTFSEVKCLAENIYFEARNQPWVGQVAVAQVAINRAKDLGFPNTICGVVKQTKYYPSGRIDLHSCQFSWYCDGKSDKPYDLVQYDKAFKTAMIVYSGAIPDVTEGSLCYHALYIKKPFWASGLKVKVKINDHIFYAAR